MIDKLELNNFTVFSDLSIKFSPKINIIIGENGTGKTHLLKAAYTLCSANNQIEESDDSEDKLKTSITEKLKNIFKPLEDKLWNIRKYGTERDSKASLAATFLNETHSIGANFNINSQQVGITDNNSYLTYQEKPIYIPTKEVLSFMKGFSSLLMQFPYL